MVPTVPLETLMAQSERVSIRRRNCGAGCCGAAFRGSEIEPPCPQAGGALQVIEAHVNVALGKIAVLGDNVGPRAGQIR